MVIWISSFWFGDWSFTAIRVLEYPLRECPVPQTPASEFGDGNILCLLTTLNLMNSSTPTLLLDGIWGRPRRFEGMLRMLRERVGPAEIFRYNSSGMVPFDELGEQLGEAVARFDRPVNLVGFSMGGLVIRAAKLLKPELPIYRAAFLNTPHRGSVWAYALPIGGIRQMRFGDPFIRALKETPWDVPTIVSWCPMDTAVVPGRSARLGGARETICCGVPVHVWPIFSRYIQGRVVEFLEEGKNE